VLLFTEPHIIFWQPPISCLVYEILEAVFTTVRSVQALNIGGSWKTQKTSLTYSVLREGPHYYSLEFLHALMPNCSAQDLYFE
jgi:hypothetical protein